MLYFGKGNRMKCPVCGSYKIAVMNTRTDFSERYKRRHRVCECGHTWNTIEMLEEEYNALVKKATKTDQRKKVSIGWK